MKKGIKGVSYGNHIRKVIPLRLYGIIRGYEIYEYK